MISSLHYFKSILLEFVPLNFYYYTIFLNVRKYNDLDLLDCFYQIQSTVVKRLFGTFYCTGQ